MTKILYLGGQSIDSLDLSAGLSIDSDSYMKVAATGALVKEITIQLPKCKSPEAWGALEPTKDAKKIEDKPESSKCPRPVANACRDAG